MVEFEIGTRKERGFVLNFSSFGLYIQTRHVAKPGTDVTVTIVADDKTTFRLTGKVASAKVMPPQLSSMQGGMGVQILAPTPEYTQYVKGLAT